MSAAVDLSYVKSCTIFHLIKGKLFEPKNRVVILA